MAEIEATGISDERPMDSVTEAERAKSRLSRTVFSVLALSVGLLVGALAHSRTRPALLLPLQRIGSPGWRMRVLDFAAEAGPSAFPNCLEAMTGRAMVGRGYDRFLDLNFKHPEAGERFIREVLQRGAPAERDAILIALTRVEGQVIRPHTERLLELFDTDGLSDSARMDLCRIFSSRLYQESQRTGVFYRGGDLRLVYGSHEPGPPTGWLVSERVRERLNAGLDRIDFAGGNRELQDAALDLITNARPVGRQRLPKIVGLLGPKEPPNGLSKPFETAFTHLWTLTPEELTPELSKSIVTLAAWARSGVRDEEVAWLVEAFSARVPGLVPALIRADPGLDDPEDFGSGLAFRLSCAAPPTPEERALWRAAAEAWKSSPLDRGARRKVMVGAWRLSLDPKPGDRPVLAAALTFERCPPRLTILEALLRLDQAMDRPLLPGELAGQETWLEPFELAEVLHRCLPVPSAGSIGVPVKDGRVSEDLVEGILRVCDPSALRLEELLARSWTEAGLDATASALHFADLTRTAAILKPGPADREESWSDLRELARRCIAARQASPEDRTKLVPSPSPDEAVEVALVRAVASPSAETLRWLDQRLREQGSLELSVTLLLSNQANWPAAVWSDKAWTRARRELLVERLKAQPDGLVGALAFRAVAEDPVVVKMVAAGELDEVLEAPNFLHAAIRGGPHGRAGQTWCLRMLRSPEAMSQGICGALLGLAQGLGPECRDAALTRLEEAESGLHAAELIEPLSRILSGSDTKSVKSRVRTMAVFHVQQALRDGNLEAPARGEAIRLLKRLGLR